MKPLPTRFWAEMSWREFARADMARAIAVLPVAAVEQHGPHLPVGVDTYIMEGYLKRVAERLDTSLPVLFLPVQTVGASTEHLAFPGTLTLSPETAQRSWIEIGESVRRAGCRKLIVLNSHGGNSSVIDLVARHLRVTQAMLVVAASWHRFGYPDDLFDAHERRHGVHAGDIETSLMRDFRPDLVAMNEARDFTPASVAMAKEFKWLSAGQPVPFGWMAQDLSPEGAMGNAALASAQKGRRASDHGAQEFQALLRDVHAFDLGRLPPGPHSNEAAARRGDKEK